MTTAFRCYERFRIQFLLSLPSFWVPDNIMNPGKILRV